MDRMIWAQAVGLLAFAAAGCGDDDGHATEADRVGVGASCTVDDDCTHPDEDVELTCLEFKSGYCGLVDCQATSDCPEGSACVNHDGRNYCFRTCVDKLECNENRAAPAEDSNCVSNVEYASDEYTGKACVPPTGS